VVTETCSRRSYVGNQGGARQRVTGDLPQRLLSGVAAQIGDVIEAKIYDGLTPVTMTL